MSEVEMASTAATVGQVHEMSNRAQDRIGTARNISQRLQSLRVRLIGGVGNDASKKEVVSPAEPVRPEVDDLSHNLNILGDILNEIDSDLQALEGL